MTALLVASGLLAIVVAGLHGYLGETRLIAPATFPSRQARSLMRAMWQFTAALWAACGACLPLLTPPSLRAERSNPGAACADGLGCFASLAMTDGEK